MSIDEEAIAAPPATRVALPSRRELLKLGGSAALGIGAFALAACEQSNPGTTAGAADTSVLDKWISSKKARLGVDLTFPPQGVECRMTAPLARG